MGKVKDSVKLSQKILEVAKSELNKEREERLAKDAKKYLEELDEAKRTVNLLEKKLRNFLREIDVS